MSAVITVEDYRTFFDLPLRTIAAKNDFYNILTIYAEDFESWSEEAASLSFINISDLLPKARRVAYINPPDSRMLLMKMMKPMMNGEFRHYESGQEAEALAWVKG